MIGLRPHLCSAGRPRAFRIRNNEIARRTYRYNLAMRCTPGYLPCHEKDQEAGLITLAQLTTSIKELPGIHSSAMQARAGDLPGLK